MSSFSTKEMESSSRTAHTEHLIALIKWEIIHCKSAPNKGKKVIFMHLLELIENKEAPFWVPKSIQIPVQKSFCNKILKNYSWMWVSYKN